MLKWFGKYFGFNHRELRGITALGVALLLFWLIPRIYRHGWPAEHADASADMREIEQFLAAPFVPVDRDPLAEITYFTFDPNGLPTADWERLGLADRQIRMIKNYEAKGGRFRNREDLKKIYAITDADYARLEPYVRIRRDQVHIGKDGGLPAERQVVAQPVHREVNTDQLVGRHAPWIELNAADSIELQELPGIGPVYASRIVRFRDLLGGFHQTSQLLDVYGFDSTRFDGLKSYVYVDTAAVVKIPINSADYGELRKHPFISSKLANLIVQYRKQHGPFRRKEDLFNIAIMDAEIFRTIAPYLTIAHD